MWLELTSPCLYSIKVIEYILRNASSVGLNCNFQDVNRQTFAHLAFEIGNLQIVHYL